MSWSRVYQSLPNAKAITWDGCHKIYLLMDEEQVGAMRRVFPPAGLGGYQTERVDPNDINTAFARLVGGYEESCGLRFIQSIRTTAEPNDGFTNLIAQFEMEDEDSEQLT
jgi:hypothetical protein